MRFKYAFLGVLFASSVCAQYGCTVADDSADDTTPTAGSSTTGSAGHAGTSASSGGSSAMIGDAGAGGAPDETVNGGSAGSAVVSGGAGGSTSGRAGSGGASSGASGGHTSTGGATGSAGSAGSGSVAGASSGGGSATQSAACTSCANTNCNTATTNGCAHIAGADTAKCQAVLDCIISSNCATAADGTSPCYCGKESTDMCFFEASASTLTGACTQTIETATGGVMPLQISLIFYDNSTPVGAATQHVECEQQKCKAECF